MADKKETNPDFDCVLKFVKKVWNENRYEEIAAYLDDHFVDHTIPYSFLQNKEGLLLYLDQLSKMASHVTEILELTALHQLVVCRIRVSAFDLLDTETNGASVEVFEGYRLFRMKEHKIIEHWEIL